jgi:hypothetical protein
MKRLILVLLLAIYCPLVSAQVELEGRFELNNPQNQVWDGRYLVYTLYKDVFIYDTQTELLHKEQGQSLPKMAFKNGLYFRQVNDKFQLRKVGDNEPVLPQLFSKITDWFGTVILGWEETSPTLDGILGVWYDLEKGVIANHTLKALYKAVGYERKYLVNTWNVFDSKPWNNFLFFYQDGLITLRNPETQMFGFFDLKLQRVISEEFNNADPFFEGLAAVQNTNGLWGFIDKSGIEVIPFIHTKRPWPFHSGLSRVENKEGRVGFIDKSGKSIIPFNYGYASNFYKGMTIAKKLGFPETFTLLDSIGKETDLNCQKCKILSGSYYTTPFLSYFPIRNLKEIKDSELVIVTGATYSYVLNKDGEEVLPPEYALIKDLENGKAIVIKGSNYGVGEDHQYFLIDLATKKPLIKLSYTEF